MNIIIIQITDYLNNNEFFKTIKDKERFAKLMFDTYSMRCDIMTELKKMNAWVSVNENRRKKRYDRFINSWLSRNNKYGRK